MRNKKLKKKQITKKLLIALKESENIINGKIKAKRYVNFDELLKDIN